MTRLTFVSALDGARKTADGGLSDRHYYLKIGKITPGVAKKAGIEPGDIVVDADALQHIVAGHTSEIEAIGLSVLEYLKFITSHYNRIYTGTGNSYLLVVFPDISLPGKIESEIANVAAIQANYSIKKGFWEIATAQPRKAARLRNKILLWKK